MVGWATEYVEGCGGGGGGGKAAVGLEPRKLGEQRIDGATLLALEDGDLAELGVESGLQRRKLLVSIRKLQGLALPSAKATKRPPEPPIELSDAAIRKVREPVAGLGGIGI